jgi:hypothetical protein
MTVSQCGHRYSVGGPIPPPAESELEFTTRSLWDELGEPRTIEEAYGRSRRVATTRRGQCGSRHPRNAGARTPARRVGGRRRSRPSSVGARPREREPRRLDLRRSRHGRDHRRRDAEEGEGGRHHPADVAVPTLRPRRTRLALARTSRDGRLHGDRGPLAAVLAHSDGVSVSPSASSDSAPRLLVFKPRRRPVCVVSSGVGGRSAPDPTPTPLTRRNYTHRVIECT